MKQDANLLGYIDSDYARDIDDRKSTSGYVLSKWSSNMLEFKEVGNCHTIIYRS